jgi:hypothetical protein
MNSYSKTGPISKALYKDKESDLAVPRHLLNTATIRRLGSNLSSCRKAEKDGLYRERRDEIISRQKNVPAASKKRDIDNRSKKVIFLERVHNMKEEDPSFNKWARRSKHKQ